MSRQECCHGQRVLMQAQQQAARRAPDSEVATPPAPHSRTVCKDFRKTSEFVMEKKQENLEERRRNLLSWICINYRKKTSDFKECAVTLLVKYKLSIESIKTYPEITKMPFSETHNTVTLNLD